MVFSPSEEARLHLSLQGIGVALNLDGRGIVQYLVSDGGSDDRIAEDFIPLAKTTVRSEDQDSFLVAPGDELKEKVRPRADRWGYIRSR